MRLPRLGRRTHGDRRLVLVVGIGRSGTSVLTRALSAFGYAVPQPEVPPDETNPRGFAEPQWVVDFQTELLARHRISNFDGRPAAWGLAEELCADPAAVTTLRGWLDDQLDQHDRVVVKDPRTAWLLPLWSRAAAELGVAPSYVTMLRLPVQVVASAKRWYGEGRHETSRLAGWTNVMLHTEQVTRGAPRAFVAYEQMLADWRSQLRRLDDGLGLALDLADAAAAAHVDEFVDPSLHREHGGWDDVRLPQPLRDVATRSWQALSALTTAAPADPASFDELRADYDRVYHDAELVAVWSIAAARAAKKPKKSSGAKAARTTAPPPLG